MSLRAPAGAVSASTMAPFKINTDTTPRNFVVYSTQPNLTNGLPATRTANRSVSALQRRFLAVTLGPGARPHALRSNHRPAAPAAMSSRSEPDAAMPGSDRDDESHLTPYVGTSAASNQQQQQQQEQQQPQLEDSAPAPGAPKRRGGRKPRVTAAATSTVAETTGDGAASTDADAPAAPTKPRRSRQRKTDPAAAADVASGSAVSFISSVGSDSEDAAADAASPSTGSATAPVRRRGRSSSAATSSTAARGRGGVGTAGAAAAAAVVDGFGALPVDQGQAGAGAGAGEPEVVFSGKVPPGPEWTSVRQWVVFSDLHVRQSSLGTCLEVLRAVEEEAARRQAGIMFLGDFWDKRGSIPVEPLNQVLQEMSRWRQPVLMLVGNHDQVDLGGRQHSLTPLELACPLVHVFDEPTVWHGALWLPYRRHTGVLERAMALAVKRGGRAGGTEAGEGDGGEGGGAGSGDATEDPLRAIFLHADVRTARTNQWRQAEEGLDPGTFPPALPAYSGHYHLPHTVRNTNIMYVGSPYQVSMSEASETKRLLVLDAASWTVREEIPLAIGPRHVRLSGPAACQALQTLAAATSASSLFSASSVLDASLPSSSGASLDGNPEQWAAGAVEGGAGGGGVAEEGAEAGVSGSRSDGGSEPAGEWPEPLVSGETRSGTMRAAAATLRPGDRVKLWLSTAEAQDERVVQAMAELERAGVRVEQVLQPEARAPRVAVAEGLTPEAVLDVYCGPPPPPPPPQQSQQQQTRGGEEGSEVAVAMAAGLGGLSAAAAASVREAVAAAREAAGGGGGEGEGSAGRSVELELESVTMQGFGPFVEEQTYPLSSRGVRVISGANEDEPGADSNGAGKTTLVTAPLWALTGDVLGRTESGGGGRIAVDSMRHEGSRSCAVVLRGRLNGAAFEVEREVKRGKTSALRFVLGGEDLTMQDIPGTADRIRRHFSTELLRCCTFFGQNDITGLLEANDAALKQKLGLVVDLEIWEAARQLLIGPRKAAATAAAAASGRVAVLVDQAGRRGQEVAGLRQREGQWAAEQEGRLAQLAAAAREAAVRGVAAAAALGPARAAARDVAARLRAAAAAAEEHQRACEAELREERARRQVEAAAAAAAAQPTPAPQPPQPKVASSSQTPDEEGRASKAGEEAEEEAALRVLAERQEEAARLRTRVEERQRAASLALGRLRQLEASLQEYQGAVSQLAAASTATTVNRVPKGTGNGVGNGRQHGSGNGNGTNGSGAQLLRLDEQTGQVVLAAGCGPGSGLGSDSDNGSGSDSGQHIRAVCDRCRQPISEDLYAANVARLEGGIDEARKLHEAAALELREAERAQEAANQLLARANAEAAARARRRLEAESRAAAEARAAAAAAEARERQAAEAARRVQEAAWQEAERALQGLQTRMAASNKLRSELLAAAADLDRTAADVNQAQATWLACEAAVLRDAGAASSSPSHLEPPSTAFDPVRSQPSEGLGAGTEATAGTDTAAGPLLSSAGAVAGEGRRAAQAVLRAVAGWQGAAQAAEGMRREGNPHTALRARAEDELEELGAQQQEAEEARAASDARLRALTDADRALGRTGIPSLLLEEVLAQLQTYTARFLERLCEGFVLELSSTRPLGGAAGGGRGRGGRVEEAEREKDEIMKRVKVRSPVDGSLQPRDVRQLSGGERRRVALALCLGFEALVRSRRRLVSNLMVLDEVLQQLDNRGCELVAEVLRDLPHGSVLVVGQTNSSVTNNFELIDVVVKEGGASRVRVTA